MLSLVITHPDSAGRSPRALSDGGRQQALAAARRLRELIGKRVAVGKVLSSPKARCLETALLVARELGETTQIDCVYDAIEVIDELAESSEPIKPNIFSDVLQVQGMADFAILISMHGDLANAIGGLVSLIDGISSDGWFDVRPVISIISDKAGLLSVSHCETFRADNWISCMEVE